MTITMSANIPRSPLHWPAHRPRTPRHQREDARWSKDKKPVTIGEATKRLMAEIRLYTRTGHAWRIDPEQVVISTNLKYRQDGLPYSVQREPDDQGVAVYFTLDGKEYCLPCDKWTRIADNIAAIAAHLAANRGIERWGVGETSDVYAGFAALPAAGQSTASNPWIILGIQPTRDTDAIHAAWRAKSKAAHPDAGGNRQDWDDLQEALNLAIQQSTTIQS